MSTSGSLEEQVAELAAMVQALEDRRDIIECLHRYSRGLDRRDWDYLASAYHEDAIETRGEFHETVQEFITWLSNHMLPWDHSLHMLDVNSVDIRGDVAYTECYVIFSQRRADNGTLDFGGARYVDKLERRQGEWKIAHRQLIGDWASKVPTVDRPASRHVKGRLDKEDLSYRFKAE